MRFFPPIHRPNHVLIVLPPHPETAALAITHAFPCRNSKHDRLEAADVELHIQRNMLKHNLSLVGWYHSHPKCAAQPTLRDCDAQLDYQMKMRGASDATYSPCVGLICCECWRDGCPD